MGPVKVRRYDRAPLGRSRRTDEGFLITPAHLTRTGVLEYLNPDGSVRRELRLPEDVFAPASLETYALKPVTRDHPADRVTSENAKGLAVGMVGSATRADDGQHVAGMLSIFDAETIRAIDRGERQLSPGYDIRLEPVPGGEHVDTEGVLGPKGQSYRADFYQRDITVNHIAIVRAARAGASASIRLDSAGNATDPDQESNTMKIKIGAAEFDVPEAVAAEFAALTKSRTDAGELEKAQAKLAVVEGQKAELQKRLDAVEAERAATAKAALAAEAAKHLGEKAEDLQRLDADEIKRRVVAKLAPTVRLDGKSSEYLGAAYDMATAQRVDSADAAGRLAAGAKGGSESREDADDPVAAARAEHERSINNAWKPAAKA